MYNTIDNMQGEMNRNKEIKILSLFPSKQSVHTLSDNMNKMDGFFGSKDDNYTRCSNKIQSILKQNIANNDDSEDSYMKIKLTQLKIDTYRSATQLSTHIMNMISKNMAMATKAAIFACKKGK